MRILVWLLVVCGVLLAGWIISKATSKKQGITAAPVPTLVDPPQHKWAILIFTSIKCRTCPGVVSLVKKLLGELPPETDVVMREYSYENHRDVHKKYNVDSVPLTLLVDSSGSVKSWFFGPLDIGKIRDKIQLPQN